MQPATAKAPHALYARRIVHRTRGARHGPITRLMSPGDLGEMLKPFIFLDLFEAESMDGPGFAPHPHSGIATLTTFLEGRMTYADSTGKRGELTAGAVEWMRAGEGVWHAGGPLGGGPMRGYQLWLALPPEAELAPPESLYLDPARIPARDGIRVVLGDYEGLSSPLKTPFSITYLHVRLEPGARWTYQPCPGHDVAFLALNSGRLHTAGQVLERELAVFEDGGDPVHLIAEGPVEMVIGSAARHPHDLVTGYYSVHTSAAALAEGERTIPALGRTPAVAALHQRG
jgi:redox-sensitive bicupin YhaK (pirin superfamily)